MFLRGYRSLTDEEIAERLDELKEEHDFEHLPQEKQEILLAEWMDHLQESLVPVQPKSFYHRAMQEAGMKQSDFI